MGQKVSIFGAEPRVTCLDIALLHLARGDIVHEGVTRDVGLRVLHSGSAHVADHHAKVALVVHAAVPVLDDDRLLGGDAGGGYLAEERGSGGKSWPSSFTCAR